MKKKVLICFSKKRNPHLQKIEIILNLMRVPQSKLKNTLRDKEKILRAQIPG
jgi:hypothetical protein